MRCGGSGMGYEVWDMGCGKLRCAMLSRQSFDCDLLF